MHHHSAHTGLDIRSVLRQQHSMFGDSLLPREKNIAPAFRGPQVTRPQNRQADISFEAGVEHESRLQAAHGRRAAQRDAYIAAGANAQQPTSFHQVAAVDRHQKRHNAMSASASSNFEDPSSWQTLLASDSGGFYPKQQQQQQQQQFRAPAGRGLSREVSREGSARVSRGGLSEGGVPGGSSGFAVAELDGGFGLSGLSLNATAPPRTHSLSSSMPHNAGRGGTGGQAAARERSAAAAGAAAAEPPSSPPRYVLSEPPPAVDAGYDAHESGDGMPSAPAASPSGSPTKMIRAREWSAAVEDAYRLQEAGYRDEREALSLGHPPIERWPEPIGFIRKLVTRQTLGKADKQSLLYFPKRRECEDKLLNQVKLYQY